MTEPLDLDAIRARADAGHLLGGEGQEVAEDVHALLARITELEAEKATWRRLANEAGELIESRLPEMRKIEAERDGFAAVIEQALAYNEAEPFPNSRMRTILTSVDTSTAVQAIREPARVQLNVGARQSGKTKDMVARIIEQANAAGVSVEVVDVDTPSRVQAIRDDQIEKDARIVDEVGEAYHGTALHLLADRQHEDSSRYSNYAAAHKTAAAAIRSQRGGSGVR